jgi:hypothetical protein
MAGKGEEWCGEKVNGMRDSILGRDKAPISDGSLDEEEIPPQSSRKAWSIANKPQMGVAIFSVKGNYIMSIILKGDRFAHGQA